MNSVYCNRCGMTFEIKNVLHDVKKSTVCAEKDCTRSYTCYGGEHIDMFPTEDDVL